jgi:hypothetical protein
MDSASLTPQMGAVYQLLRRYIQDIRPFLEPLLRTLVSELATN